MVRVVEGTEGAFKIEKKMAKGIRSYTKFIKSIPDLRPEDELVIAISCQYNRYLHGALVKAIRLGSVYPDRDVKRLTVSQFHIDTIKFAVGQLKGFPVGYNDTKHGSVKYKNALFALTEHQFDRSNGGHHYLITPISRLGIAFAAGLQNDSRGQTIFADHGYTADFHINPHQLRHWHNDIAEREGIPHALINLWSGRKNPEQIIHYIHTTDAEKASKVADILFPETDENISIKVCSQQQLDALIQTPTTITSVGVCTQNLMTSPCTYLNDFITQCTYALPHVTSRTTRTL